MDGDTSARLDLPYLAAGQLQKHVTLNEALARLDALVQCAVVSRTLAAQPTTSPDGALYILPIGATGSAWGSRAAGDLMRAEMGGWIPVSVPDGVRVWVRDEDQLIVRDGGVWVPLGERIGALQHLTRLGLGTTADAGNPFSVKLNTALWTARGVGEAGNGDLRMTLNKEAAADVLSLLFQSGYGGRAELGLIGDDDLTLKVSADGGTWRTAMVVNRTSGDVVFPAGAARIETTQFTASGVYVVPTWARRIEAVAVGGGGGGGAGACGASATSRFGGGGGGAGGAVSATFNTADLAASLAIAIGVGGAPGAGGASATGAAGGGGGFSTVSSGGVVILTGRNGSGGQGGSATAGVAGAGGPGSVVSNGGGSGSVTATAGAGVSLTRSDGPGGGGGGGGLDASNTIRAGGAGGSGGTTLVIAAGGAGGNGGAGGAGGSAPSPSLAWPGGGGGGGGASPTAGHAGGAGATFGAGGGGGGAGVSASGAGGGGGSGLVRITAMG